MIHGQIGCIFIPCVQAFACPFGNASRPSSTSTPE